MPSLIFRKGLDLKHAVAGMLADNYHSALVDRIKAEDFTFRSGRLTLHLAREFGFCYGEGGYTSIIHGKVWHEETQATASQAVQYGGKYLVVFDRAETDLVCEHIRGGGEIRDLTTRFANAVSPDFDFGRDLQRIGLANQTTMLMSESLQIGEMIRTAMVERY